MGQSNSPAEMQKELIQLYEKHWDAIQELRKEHPELSNPLLVAVPETYSTPRLVYVGQETNTWYDDREPTIQNLLEAYREFNLAENSPRASSPFWNFHRQLCKGLNIDPFSTVWTNLHRMDIEGNSADDLARELASLPLLREELRILKPDIIVFATSWRNDAYLKEQLPEAEFKEVEGFDPKLLVEVSNLGTLAFRTYHPKHLRMTGDEQKVRSAIVKNCFLATSQTGH